MSERRPPPADNFAPMPDIFTTHDWISAPDILCHRCMKVYGVRYRAWPDGDGHTDHVYRCTCGHVWWVDGRAINGS